MQSAITYLCRAGRISPCVTIGVLPDNVLLDVFEFYREVIHLDIRFKWPWYTLVHVCRRWRYVVFGSPFRLNVCLRCTYKTRESEMLNIWPPLPITIHVRSPHKGYDVDDIIATLEHRDRIRRILIIHPTSSQFERLASMMQEPFPALTCLQLELQTGETTPALPNIFLGGSTPRLQALFLNNIPFPGLSRLLLSTTDLSILWLERIPDTGYISPEAMVTGLSGLTRLRYLTIRFESAASRPDRHPPPLTRVILPALKMLTFQGVSEYLGDLMARIDAPRLCSLYISFFNQIIFDVQQLFHFIGRAGILTSSSRASVFVSHWHDHVEATFHEKDSPNYLGLKIYCRGADRQVRSVARICKQLSFLPSIVEELYIDCYRKVRVDIEGAQWLQLFRPFTAVRTLRMCRNLKPLIVRALRELTGERATEVLPALDSLYLEESQPSGSEQQAIEPFIAARQHSDHPVVVHRWGERWD